MPNGQVAMVSLPFPSQWDINANIGGRPSGLGTLRINSVSGNCVNGAVNFRGTFIPIRGCWNERTRQLSFDSPYASFVGQLSIFNESGMRLRHYVLEGRVTMRPPSIRAGETGTWRGNYDARY